MRLSKEQREIAEWFVNLTGVFCHYSFFTDKLWKQVKGFEKEDEAEVIVAFIHYWLHHKYQCYTLPVGCGWFCELGEDSYNRYIEKWQPVIEAYENWVMEQRKLYT